jgi:hypothetical protein
MTLGTLGITSLLVIYFGIWRRAQTKRQRRSWDELVASLRLEQLVIQPIPEESPDNLWRRLGGARGLMAVYRQIPTLLAIADYVDAADQNGCEEMLASLRADALQLRLSLIVLLCHCSFTHSKSHIAGPLQNSVDSYRNLMERISTLTESYTASIVPALS